MKINEQVIWELIKYIFSYIQYIFLSKKGKLESNLRLVKEKHWFQQLVDQQPNILNIIEADKDLKDYFSKRKKVRKLLRDKEERQNFKNWLGN